VKPGHTGDLFRRGTRTPRGCTLVAASAGMSDWMKAQEFSTRFEAEVALARLQSSLIPAMMKSHEGGFFGPGFQGAVPSGVDLFVPRQLLPQARELLQGRSETTA
jgi:hypothetical protein